MVELGDVSAGADNGRFAGVEVVRARELLARRNRRNWRSHREHQRKAMREVLEHVGSVDTVTISVRTGIVLDGELRIELAAERDDVIRVEYLDLVDEDEEAAALLLIDGLAELAGHDESRAERLIRRGALDFAAERGEGRDALWSGLTGRDLLGKMVREKRDVAVEQLEANPATPHVLDALDWGLCLFAGGTGRGC